MSFAPWLLTTLLCCCLAGISLTTTWQSCRLASLTPCPCWIFCMFHLLFLLVQRHLLHAPDRLNAWIEDDRVFSLPMRLFCRAFQLMPTTSWVSNRLSKMANTHEETRILCLVSPFLFLFRSDAINGVKMLQQRVYQLSTAIGLQSSEWQRPDRAAFRHLRLAGVTDESVTSNLFFFFFFFFFRGYFLSTACWPLGLCLKWWWKELQLETPLDLCTSRVSPRAGSVGRAGFFSFFFFFSSPPPGCKSYNSTCQPVCTRVAASLRVGSLSFVLLHTYVHKKEEERKKEGWNFYLFVLFCLLLRCPGSSVELSCE